MSTLGTIRRSVGHPGRAADYVQRPSQRNLTPAIFWIGILLFGLWWLRNGRPPDARQALTGGLAIGAVVIVGQFSRIVFWVLVAVLVAAVLGAAPQITGLLAQVQSRGVTVALKPGAPASVPK
jgi:hypothetical protein